MQEYTIKGQFPFLNNDSALVRSFCALRPCIETTFQPLEKKKNKTKIIISQHKRLIKSGSNDSLQNANFKCCPFYLANEEKLQNLFIYNKTRPENLTFS